MHCDAKFRVKDAFHVLHGSDPSELAHRNEDNALLFDAIKNIEIRAVMRKAIERHTRIDREQTKYSVNSRVNAALYNIINLETAVISVLRT